MIATAALIFALGDVVFAAIQPVGVASQIRDTDATVPLVARVAVDQYPGKSTTVAPGDSAEAEMTCPDYHGQRMQSVSGGWNMTGKIGASFASVTFSARTSLYNWDIVVSNPKLADGEVTFNPTVECLQVTYAP